MTTRRRPVRVACIGVVLGAFLGLMLVSVAEDYCDLLWNGHIWYSFHKQRHNTSSTATYHLDPSLDDLPGVTLSQAATAIGQAASGWSEGSSGYFNWQNVQGSDLVFYAYYEEEGPLAQAGYDYVLIGGQYYFKAVCIEYNSYYYYEWDMHGEYGVSYSVRGVTNHELGHLIDLDDTYENAHLAWIMYGHIDKGPDKNVLHQRDKDTITRIYRDHLWTSFSSATSTMTVVA